MIYGSSHMSSLFVNLILGLEDRNGFIKGYKPDIKIPFSAFDSTHQIGPDYIWLMLYGWCHLKMATWPPPGVPNWFSCSMGYRSAIMNSCSDSESPQKTNLDASWIIPNGAGHISWFFATITDLAILGATMGISNFPVQIQNLLKRWI